MNSNITLQATADALRAAVAADDSHTRCPCCGQRARNDAKGLNRYLAQTLQVMVDYFRKNPETDRVHMSDLLLKTIGKRDASCAHLRFWGLIKAEDRPEDAGPELKGSRGFSGFWSVTQRGFDFVDGKVRVAKTVRKPFQGEWKEDDALITFSEALQSIQMTNGENVIVNGETK